MWKEKRLKSLTPNKSLARGPLLLSQTKVGNKQTKKQNQTIITLITFAKIFLVFEFVYNFTLSKSYVYLLNVESGNLVCLKSYNTEFDEIFKILLDQNSRPLEK